MASKTRDNTIVVTGGSGCLGNALVPRLLKKYPDVKVKTISTNENEIQRMIWLCNSNRLEPVMGDIRDTDILRFALRDANSVIHLAAMKHVDFCEANPLEAIRINVVGTINLLKYFEGETFIGMSTDKALEPSGCYGATKLLLERLALERAKHDENKRYMIVRSGNIFASSGSVVERWRQQIETSNEIVATSLGMTRFFTGVDTLAEFIIEVMEKGANGNIYIPRQKAVVLRDLADAVTAFWGNKDTKVRVVGLRKGEKEHEKLLLSGEKVITELKNGLSQSAEKMSTEEITDLLRASAKQHY